MAHFTFIAHGLTSPLNASLELSRRLTKAGHRVTYVSHADIGSEVEAHGFRFVRLTEDQEIRESAVRGAGVNPLAWIMALRSARSRSIASDEIERIVADLAPDMLLIDIEMHYPIITTSRLGIRTMLVMNWLSIFRLPDLPPLNTSLMPGNARSIKRAWLRVRADAFIARLKHKLSRGGVGDVLRPVSYGTRFYADLKQVARKRGYLLDANTDRRQWLRPYTYTKLPVLCLNAFELEFPHTPHPNIRYVGPMVNRDRPERRVDTSDMRRWHDYKAKRAAAAGKRPLVYCSLGSYWSDPQFLQTVLATFRGRPDWDLVLGLGDQANAAELGPISDNVLLLGYAPQLEVLAEADCAINHGGITSINECISFRVPMIVCSPHLLDQDGCAARIEYHGLGVSAEWTSLNPSQLEQHVDNVLSNNGMRDNLGTLQQAFDRYETDNVAVRVIEDYLASNTPE